MNDLYKMYGEHGLEIIDFPSNDFKNQEPKTNPEIKAWIAKTYQSKFLVMAKDHVNGPDTSEVYRWLRTNSEQYNQKTRYSEIIPWNYAKFLIDGSTGKVIKYNPPIEAPLELKSLIENLLNYHSDLSMRKKAQDNAHEAQGTYMAI